MIFARKVWAILVGIKDGFALLFLLLFFWALYAVLTARPNPGLIREGALLLKLDGTVVEEPARIDPFALLLGQGAPTKEYRERDLVRAIEAAAKDDRVKAVVLDLDQRWRGSWFSAGILPPKRPRLLPLKGAKPDGEQSLRTVPRLRGPTGLQAGWRTPAARQSRFRGVCLTTTFAPVGLYALAGANAQPELAARTSP